MRRRIDSVTGTLLSRRLCGDQPPQALYRLLKNSHFCHSERSEESLFDFKSNAQRDSSAKNPPRNDKNMLFPQPIKPCPTNLLVQMTGLQLALRSSAGACLWPGAKNSS